MLYHKLLEGFHFLAYLFFFPEAKIIKNQCGPNGQVGMFIIRLNIVYYRNP